VSVVEKSLGSLKSSPTLEDSAVIAAPPASNPGTHNDDSASGPDHIPVVENVAVTSDSTSSSSNNNNNSSNSPKEVVDEDDENNNKMSSNNIANDIEDEPMIGGGPGNHSEEEDESDYEYEDEDDVAFSGFLMSSNTMATSATTSNDTSSSAPARIEEESGAVVVAAAASLSSLPLTEASPSDMEADQPKKKWREPTRAAVNMSLRAEQETSGSKRRLAQDLYRIMNQDTEEAGFSLAPQSEDSMESWTIKLFQFDPDSNLAKDMMVLGIEHIELEMKFPDQYPFEPPFVRVVKPRFKRQTGFVMNGALCMELLTKDGWNPINDIESVIVSIRSLLVVGDGRLQAAAELTEKRYKDLLKAAQEDKTGKDDGEPRLKKARLDDDEFKPPVGKGDIGSYSAAEAQSAYSHLSDYHKKKGWDTSGWWARKG
jgi:ubiquitin-conjugating enzyme E2 Q